ncbi:alpha/beta fold hydrolase [Streptosporangium vulgare]|uniref:alpha/beta fold hydrolase n=1 Tax=Streptosporangium vulgare TaxID=46190 RepID=UPI0031D9D1E5
MALAGALTARGHRVLALDLVGHGTRARFPASYLTRDVAALRTEVSPLAGLSLDDVAADVVAGLRRFAAPPIVAAHSMGGTVATRVAELAPELVAGLVYVTAFVPTSLGRRARTWPCRRRGPRSAAGSTWVTPRQSARCGSTRAVPIPPTRTSCTRPTSATSTAPASRPWPPPSPPSSRWRSSPLRPGPRPSAGGPCPGPTSAPPATARCPSHSRT